VYWLNLIIIHFQFPSPTLKGTAIFNTSAASTQIHIQTSNPPRRNTLKHAIEARIVSRGLFG